MEFHPNDVETVETFPCIETRLLLAAESLLLNGKSAKSLALTEKRKRSLSGVASSHRCFCAGPGFGPRRPVDRDCPREFGKASNESIPSVAEMIRAYTEFTQPWMMADRLHRHWESRLLNIDPDESGGASEFEKLVAKVRHDYAALVDELNRVFVRVAEAAHFER